MRIKKVSQTTPTQAQVVDGYSTSTTDPYSANYVNGIGGNVLWTNPNPSTAISTDTSITLSSSDYDLILWVFRVSISNNQTDSDFSLKGYGLRHYIGNVYRTIARNSDTSYTINASSDASYNNAAIPLYAIGYKISVFN